MYLTDIFIKRKVLSLSITIALFVTGLIAFQALPIRQFPVINVPTITITTQYPGASPNLMASFVTTPITKALTGIPNVDYILASNTQGLSTITIWLKSAKNADGILARVNTKVNSVRWKLPKNILSPSIELGSKGSPVLYLGITSDSATKSQITDFVKRAIEPQINAITGVRELRTFGADYTMRIALNPFKMSAHQVTAVDVSKALLSNSLQSAMGKLEGPQQEFNISANTTLNTAKGFNELIVKHQGARLTRIKDIGEARLQNQHALIRSNIGGQRNGVILAVIPLADANSIELAQTLTAKMPNMQAKMPPNMTLSMLWDTSQFSKNAVDLVYTTIWQSVLCVVIVIFAFLGCFRSLIVPIATIPLSLVGGCTIMYLLGFSLNTFTLLAFVLAIGLVVDDAIVVLENIHRHMQNGLSSFKAAIVATREIGLPVIAMTLVVAVVFVPIALTSGITGKLFEEFGLTLSITVLLSGLFSLILSPMMSASLLKGSSHSPLAKKIDHLFGFVERGYQALLRQVVHHKITLGLIYAIILSIFIILITHIPSELVPDENQGVVLGIGIAPTSDSEDKMQQLSKEMGKAFSGIKETSHYGIVTGFAGPSSIISWLVMRPPKPNDRSEAELIDFLRPKLASIPGLMAFPMNRPPLAEVTGFDSPVQFVLQTYGSYDNLNKAMQKLLQSARKNPNILNAHTDIRINKPQLKLTIDREKAARLGISIKDIADTFAMLYARPMLSWFSLNGLSYPVIPQIDKQYKIDPQQLQYIYVKNNKGSLIPLQELVSSKTVTVPQSLNQFQGLRSATLKANLAPNYTLGQALAYLEKESKHILNDNMQYDFSSTSRQFVQSQGMMQIIYSVALAAIFLLLAIKFNSFVDPFIVLLSVPLAITGALFTIHMLGFTLNIYTQIGLVMLIGLISKHGILIVNFANHLQEQGLTIEESVIKAATIRLRPILMTTGAMVFGAIPLALATGQGSLSVKQIGAVIISGLSFGSLLTLFIVPTFYCVMASKATKEDEREN